MSSLGVEERSEERKRATSGSFRLRFPRSSFFVGACQSDYERHNGTLQLVESALNHQPHAPASSFWLFGAFLVVSGDLKFIWDNNR